MREKFHFDGLGNTSPVHVHVILVPNKTMHGGKFQNEQDLVKRIKGITIKSIENSDVELIFTLRCDEETQIVYNRLLNVKWIKQLCPKEILETIAQYTIGQIEKCDNCSDTIVMVDHANLYVPKQWPLQLLPENAYLHIEYDNMNGYYYRDHEWLGNALYCYNCFRYLKNCSRCKQTTYISNDDTTYNICPGRHIFRLIGTEVDEDFEYKLCKDCSHCQHHFDHALSEASLHLDLIMVHEETYPNQP